MSKLNFSVSPAVEKTNAPPIPRAQAWGREYVASSSPAGDLLDLSQGVPRLGPHPSYLTALADASSDAQSAKYGPILGVPAFQEAFAEEIRLQYRLGDFKPDGDEDGASGSGGPGVVADDIAITTGCNMAFLALVVALCPPNKSSVLLPLPTYFNNAMSMSLQSVEPVYIPCYPEDGFKANIASAKEYLSSFEERRRNGEEREPRMIVLVSPNNPSGAVYTPEELKEWYDLAKKYKIALVLDETYRDFVEPPQGEEGLGRPHELFEEEDWRGTFVSLGSFSKGYRIPGHRLGSIIASPILLNHLTTICDCMQICAPRPPQIALAPLLPSLRSDIHASCAELSHRRKLFVETVNAVEGWKVISTGGFFAYVEFPSDYVTASSAIGLKRKKLGSEDIAKVMALRLGVVVLPGCFFMPDLADDEAWSEVVHGDRLREDKWLRFAVANVSDEVVVKLGPRLQQMNALMGMA